MRINHTKFIHGVIFLALAFLTGCNGGGGGGGGAPTATTYTIGGTVTGLTGTGLVLQNKGGDNLAVSAGATAFTFSTAQANGSTYQVVVLTHPSGQTCTVSSSSGTVSAANVTTVVVTCTTSTNTFTIGGTITGLTGSGLVLQNNGGDNLSVSANSSFAFATPQASGSTYQVIVQTQPSGQTCTVSSSSGTVFAVNVTNVAVTCTTASNTFTIGGTVAGLTGAGLVLQNNGGDNLSITANGNFNFATPQSSGSTYQVTVLTQPAGQTCTATPTIGAVQSANVTTLSVTCSANTYTIGGTVTGLTAAGLQLQNNSGDTLTVSSGATAFTFSTALASGTTYNVTVSAQPTGQTCTVNSASGPVTSANITSVSVICSAASYFIGGAVTGLTGSVVLQNNGGDDVTVTASPYNFATKLASGSTYNVTVKTQPTAQICTVANPSGTVTTADVANANVSCVSAYTIGGTITGAAAGIGPILQNNLGDNLFIPAITTGVTSFTFSTPITDLTSYSVTQLIRARAPYQNCAINGGSGTVAGSNVTTVSITCAISTVVPKFAYVTNSTVNTATGAADTVSAYTIGVSGALTAATTATTASGDRPSAAAIDPTGQFAYVVNANAHSISGYSINATSGVLTPLPDVDGVTPGNQLSIATGDTPSSIAVHPLGKFAYVANEGSTSSNGNTLSAYSINMTSGALSTIDADAVTTGTQPTIATGTNPYSVTVDPLGKFVYVANYASNDISTYTINQTTGALTHVGTVAAGTGPSSIATDPTGKCALVANNTSDNVMSYTINQTSGALTPVTTTAAVASSAPRSVAVDPNTGLYAYVANAGLSSISAYSVNSTTCVIASIDTDAVTGGVQASITAGSSPLSVNVDPSGQFVYVANYGSNNISVYSIGVSGALTLVQTLSTGAGPTAVTTTQ